MVPHRKIQWCSYFSESLKITKFLKTNLKV
jgi:hypothetical protein